MTPQARLEGLRYEGEQPDKNFGYLTDPVTGSTFTVHWGETVGKALARLQATYKEKSGEDPVQELVGALEDCLELQPRVSGCLDEDCRACKEPRKIYRRAQELVKRYSKEAL